MTLYYTITDGRFTSSKNYRTVWAARSEAERRSALTGHRKWSVCRVWVSDINPQHRVVVELLRSEA